MAKEQLNGSAERFALALSDMVREAAREAVREEVEPLKAGIAALRTDMETGFKDAAEERQRLRSDMENGFAELLPPK